MFRARRIVAVARAHVLDPCLEYGAAVQHFALRRGQRTEPAAERSADEILVGLGGAYPGDGSLDANLALQFRPEEQ